MKGIECCDIILHYIKVGDMYVVANLISTLMRGCVISLEEVPYMVIYIMNHL